MTEAHDLSIGSDPAIAERYVVREAIASGGFAKVFRALQRTTGQEVAIKLLQLARGDLAPALEDQIQRFRREMRLCAELHHPNIVPLIDSGETTDGQLYAVFAFVPGWNLGDLLAAEGALDPVEALHFMTQIIDALSCAHAKGIVHRDLKPANIMISTTGARRNALVLDFGLGTLVTSMQPRDFRRLTHRGEFLGTPCYSAPEQLRGEPPTVCSDLYAWGLIFLECLSGEPVMGAMTYHEIVHRHLSPDPVPIPSVLKDHELGRLLRLVVEKDVERRGACAADIFAAVQRCAWRGLPSRAAIAAATAGMASQCVGDTRASLRSAAELSPIWLVPLARNFNFTGREELLRQLDVSLSAGRLLAVVALRGLGGVGKSQLALEYAYRFANRYRLVAWIRAEAPEALAADYCAIATALGLSEAPSERQKFEAVRSWLERNDHWLLIFDNAPNPEAIRAYLPRSHAGHLLVTTRHHSWRDLAACVAVEVLDHEEAVEFLLKRTGEADAQSAGELCEELGRLPLALEEAAAYLEATGRTIATYLPLLRRHRQRVLLGPPTPDHPGVLRTTWELSFRQVERESPHASDLLTLCAFLAPDDIPLELLHKGAEHLTEKLRCYLSDEVSFDGCVAALRRYSLVKIERDALSVHRLVQLVTRDRLTEPERRHWASLALRLVEGVYPTRGLAGDYYPESGRLLPHALSALSHGAPYTEDLGPAGRLLRRTGTYLSAMGSHDRAWEHLERALALFEKASAPDEDQIADVLWELGMVLYALGEPTAARERLERGLHLLERRKGPTHPLVGRDLMALSWVLRTLGEFDSTLSSTERSIEIVERTLGVNHPFTAMNLAIRASALWSLNRIGDARECAERAFTVLGLERQPLHPLMCGTWYNLGQFQLDLGETERAAECVGRSLEIGEHAYGLDHPLVCVSVRLQGSILDQRGDLEGARKCFERALVGAERACRYLHEDIAIARSALGSVLHRLGDYEGAGRALEYALEAASRVCGDRARYESHIRVSLAALFQDRGNLSAARMHCEAGIRFVEARYGADHPLRIAGLNRLGWILRDLNEPEQAHVRFREAIRIAEAAGLMDHPDYAESLEGLGALMAHPGDRSEARKRFAWALDILEHRLGVRHPTTSRVRRRLEENAGG
ncbi:MAG TPA: FxSxx-COOH system tetratricopeptide repeat protein [Myxococcota bacterium]|nr:FxSxx-COOH system tetratricopeptide repeat protein [Myxococcota bacterium]